MEITKHVINRIRDMMNYKTTVSNMELELECRYIQPISKTQFTKIVTYYRSIYPDSFKEYEETMDIITRTARLRIQGRQTIQKYCSTNILSASDVSEAVQKVPVKGYTPIFLDFLNFKVDLKEENQIKDLSEILAQLPTTPKMFRFKKRISVTDAKGGVRYDMTITKSSISNNHLNFISSGTIQSSEKYEFEIEFISTQNDSHMLLSPMMEAYMLITDTKVIVANRTKLVQDYLNLTGQASPQLKPFMVTRKPKKYLVGPKPVSIELKNVCTPPLLGTPNIVEDYTVTEKTDGERHLMYIDPSGSVYLINNRFDIMPVNIKLNSYKNSIFDGEWVSDLSLYALFDVYYVNNEDMRGKPLIPGRIKEMKDFHARTQSAFKQANVTLHMKDFLHASKNTDIFTLSKSIMEKKLRKEFPYHIDGLIYTPASLPVGGLFKEDAPTGFGTWKAVFKWKPADENTIDFLVKYERDDKKQAKVVIRNGVKYTVCVLYCGYKPTQWEKINIMEFLERGGASTTHGNTNYMARRFLPADYVGSDICYYYASSPEVEDDSIVEFSYNLAQKEWVYLRTRHDKTDLYRKNGLTDTANDWGTAMNIWHTINYPVTEKIICGAQKVNQSDVPDENVYYSRNTTRDKFASRPMMDFHNEGVKNMSLIKLQTDKCKRLLDLACGKGGDMNKWVGANIKEVVGFDSVEDNIVNPVDGAYARLQQKQKYGDIPKDCKYIFMPMDCSKPLSPLQVSQEDTKRIADILWGKSTVSSSELDKIKGMMLQPFDVVSCQFAIHYFFENEATLDTFISNVDKHLAIGGRFIGTCLDGKKVKSALQGVYKGSSLTGKKGDRVMWDIKKKYNESTKIQFGDAIDIYMESIGRIATEFLVDMSLLRYKLEKLGYKVVFIKGFDEVFQEIVPQLQGHYKESIEKMSTEEKKYSFMNCVFCFEKSEVVKKRIVVKKPQPQAPVEEPLVQKTEIEPVVVSENPQPKKRISLKRK